MPYYNADKSVRYAIKDDGTSATLTEFYVMYDKYVVDSIDNIGIISQIAATISGLMNVNMNKLSFESNDGFFTGTISLEVKNKVILNKLLKSLKKIDGIDKVSRN